MGAVHEKDMDRTIHPLGKSEKRAQTGRRKRTKEGQSDDEPGWADAPLSSPSIRIRASLSPNNLAITQERAFPIFKLQSWQTACQMEAADLLQGLGKGIEAARTNGALIESSCALSSKFRKL
jgi:hypothetical protein